MGRHRPQGWVPAHPEPATARTKSGKSRYVPITPRLLEALREHAATYRMRLYDGQRSPYLFHHEITARRARAGQPFTSLASRIKNAAKVAGIDSSFRPHDLRHRRVTFWLAEGQNVVHVKEAVGHADLATTMGYTHLVREHPRALAQPPLQNSATSTTLHNEA